MEGVRIRWAQREGHAPADTNGTPVGCPRTPGREPREAGPHICRQVRTHAGRHTSSRSCLLSPGIDRLSWRSLPPPLSPPPLYSYRSPLAYLSPPGGVPSDRCGLSREDFAALGMFSRMTEGRFLPGASLPAGSFAADPAGLLQCAAWYMSRINRGRERGVGIRTRNSLRGRGLRCGEIMLTRGLRRSGALLVAVGRRREEQLLKSSRLFGTGATMPRALGTHSSTYEKKETTRQDLMRCNRPYSRLILIAIN